MKRLWFALLLGPFFILSSCDLDPEEPEDIVADDDDDSQPDDDDSQPDDDDSQPDDDTSAIDADGDGWDETTDCNDHNATVHPGAELLCDGTMDNDCDAKLGRTATQTLTC